MGLALLVMGGLMLSAELTRAAPGDPTFAANLPVLSKAASALPAATPTAPPGSGGVPTSTPTSSPTAVSSPTATQTGTTPPGTEGALFLNTISQTNSASVQVDANGGMHFAFASWTAAPGGKSLAYHAYCGANCDSLSAWTVATISDGTSNVNKVQMALDPLGRPRLLLYGNDASFNYQWQYAACDSGCTSGANWQVTTVAPLGYNNISIFDFSLHNFALDRQGRPRFVYYDSPAVHAGTFYASCDANCTNASNWSEFQLSADHLYDPSLAFTAANQPRIAASIFIGSSSDSAVNYLECNTTCSNPANWSVTPLYDPGTGHASWVLRLDSSDRPRLAFYQGDPSGGQSSLLYYVWCNGSCAGAANWGSSSIGLARADGTDPDLALDGQGRPRLAFRTSSPDGLGYAWCDANCESQSAIWQYGSAEPSSALDIAWPLLPPAPCSTATWLGGYRPSLALDASGNPRIGYDAQHLHAGGTCVTNEDYRAVRFAFFNQ